MSLPHSSTAERSRRVLVVDDNVDAADSLATLLNVMGYNVRIAYDGPEAIEAADEFLPEVALLDIGLPRLSGYDIARHVRRKRGEDVLLVAITGWGQEEDRRRAREAGFDHHFTKPADFDSLLAVIDREFKQRREGGHGGVDG
jgi:DNA-binding response OmpR family regulator